MPANESWKVPDAQNGWRLDKAVAARPSVGSRRKSQRVVESGKVTVAGVSCTNPGRPVATGDELTIAWDRPGTGRAAQRSRATVAGAGIDILFEDALLIAVDKPPGMLTDSASRKQTRDEETVTDRLDRHARRQGKRARAAHRIDRDTSGVVLFAKDDATFDALRAQFHARTPERVYLAILDGSPSTDPGADTGTWTDWMLWDSSRLLQTPSAQGIAGAVRAEAHFRIVARLRGGRTAVEVRLVTGRRNQIRLHAMLRGHPLVGETKYLADASARRGGGITRHALHALRLGFDHPETGKRITVESPVPADLARLLARD